MKHVLFVISALTTGGAEKSLVNLLNLFDFATYKVDLLLFKREGVFLKQVPPQVNIVDIPDTLKYAYQSLDASAVMQLPALNSGIRRYVGTWYARMKYKELANKGKQIRWNRFYRAAIRELPGEYDVAISYMHGEAMYYVAEKVRAKRKITWVHNDYSAIGFDEELDRPYFERFDKIVTISEECVHKFQEAFPDLADRTRCIPNLTSASLVRKMALEYQPEEFREARAADPGALLLLSIGRLSEQKGFDIAIQAARMMKERGIRFHWFIIGHGELRRRLQQQINEAKLEDRFVLLGTRENPYPYLRCCDVVVQPSRYEGKSVVLDEAKILEKPIVVSDYATVRDQIQDGLEGVVVPLDPLRIAEAIVDLYEHPEKRAHLREYLLKQEYGNEAMIELYYEQIS